MRWPPSSLGERIPRPPRARLMIPEGSLRQRVERMRAGETGAKPGIAGSLLGLARDVILLGKDLALSPRIPRRAKLVPLATTVVAVAGARWPASRIAPVVRGAAGTVAVGWSVRQFLRGAGYDAIYEAWRGSETGLALVLTVAGVEQ